MTRPIESTVTEIGLGEPVTDFEITVTSPVVYFFVPIGAEASLKFSSASRDSIPLQSGWQSICLPKGAAGAKLFITAQSSTDPIKFFESDDAQLHFFGGSPRETSVSQSTRHTWPTAFAGFPNAVTPLDLVTVDGVLITNQLVAKNGGPLMNTDEGKVHARFGVNNISVDTDQGISSESYRNYMPILQQPDSASGPIPENLRVQALGALMSVSNNSWDAAPPNDWGNRDGIVWRTARSGKNLWTQKTGNSQDAAGVGMVGDAGGGWRFVSTWDDTGVLTPYKEIVPLTWPAANIWDPCMVWHVWISATASRLASFQIWIAGELVIERFYAADGSSPTMPLLDPSSGGFDFYLHGEGASFAGLRLRVVNLETYFGAIHPVTRAFFNGR